MVSTTGREDSRETTVFNWSLSTFTLDVNPCSSAALREAASATETGQCGSSLFSHTMLYSVFLELKELMERMTAILFHSSSLEVKIVDSIISDALTYAPIMGWL